MYCPNKRSLNRSRIDNQFCHLNNFYPTKVDLATVDLLAKLNTVLDNFHVYMLARIVALPKT